MIAKMDKKEKPQQARPPTPPAITPLSQHQTKAILQAIKKNRPICLSAYPISELSLIEHFIDLGTNAHTPSRSSRVRQTEDVSTHLACMYGIFHHVLNERLSLGSPIAKEYDIESALATCEANLNILLQDGGKTTFEPGLGSVLALTLGALRPHLSPAVSSRLLGKAAEQCLALGWNVDISHANSSSSRRLFWSVYMLEKQMSLALGRPSVFRDGDVNVRLPILARKEGVRNWDEVFLSRVGLARIQGVVLGILYEDGKDSKMKEEKERGEDREIDDYEKRVGKAATELEEWFGLLDSLSADGVEHRRLFNLQRQILEVRYYSTYTALLRGPLCSPPASTSTSYKPVPPGLMPENGRNQAHIKPECFKTARATIKTYIRACNAYKIILTMSPSPSPFARIYSPLTDWLVPHPPQAIYTLTSRKGPS
ncbi:hypothetical protein BJY04DRAFT_105363 [Aspergillus karnatakaensis]|uniref:fungal specific transcription factor domain-containing protein n=1 Tax=Aspergillus karnatakaensis TaxID=1810916 RepID=UPI003CCD8016